MTVDEDFDIPATGAIFTFGKSRFAENAPSKFWIKNDIICKVACGDEHTAIVTGSGRVFTIGNNSSGQLGLGHRKSVLKPSCVKALKPLRAVQITCGRAHTLAATESGSVFSWGHNGDGQLGSTDYEDKESPHEILKLPTPPVQLAAGSSHSMLLTDKGEVLVWGSNKEGQLGCDGDHKLIPTHLSLGNKIASIACGYYHSLAITEFGQLISWGEMEHGKLSLPKDVLSYHRHPQPVSIQEKVVMAVAGSSHSVVLSESGSVLTCGSGSSGQLGQGDSVLEKHTLTPVAGVQNLRFVYVSAGDNHSAAISEDGILFTWGCGRHGKLCLGEQVFSSQFTPTLVSRLRHLTSVQVECGGCHTMVLGYRRLMVNDSSLLPTITTPGGESKNLPQRSTSDFRVLNPKQPLCKEEVQPTVPVYEVKEGGAESLSQSTTDPALPSQETHWHESDLDEIDEGYEFSKQNEESRKKASRFAQFWNSIMKRTPTTAGYRSSKEPTVEEEPDAQLEDFESSAEHEKTQTNEFEEEEEQETTEVEPMEKQIETDRIDSPVTGVSTPVRTRTCVVL